MNKGQNTCSLQFFRTQLFLNIHTLGKTRAQLTLAYGSPSAKVVTVYTRIAPPMCWTCAECSLQYYPQFIHQKAEEQKHYITSPWSSAELVCGTRKKQ